MALAAIAYAEDIACPPNSKGKHPKCVCNNDKPYDSVNRICAITLTFKEECPVGSEGIYPHCVCTQGKVYDAIKDVCIESDRSICPKGAVKVNDKCVCENDINGYEYVLDEVFWICRPWYLQTSTTTTSTTTHRPVTYSPRCPYHQSGEYPNCNWDPCPIGYAGGNLFHITKFHIFKIHRYLRIEHQSFLFRFISVLDEKHVQSFRIISCVFFFVFIHLIQLIFCDIHNSYVGTLVGIWSKTIKRHLNYLIDFWPHCTTCEAHQSGFPPNCEWLPCPEGWRTKSGMSFLSSEFCRYH